MSSVGGGGFRFLSSTPLEAAKVPRPMILFCKEFFKDKSSLVGIELGVNRGLNAESIVKILPMKTLYLIDPYKPYMDSCGWTDTSSVRAIAHRKLDMAPVVWIEKAGKEAFEAFNRVHVDFVYVDANHSYDSVYEDISLYYPLVKDKGVLGGHDFTVLNPSVRHAVYDYATVHQADFYAQYPDWWFKPKT